MITVSELVVNIILHILILFSILSLLFWLIIRKLETNSLTDEVSNNISQYFDNLKNNLSETDKKNAKNIIGDNNKILDILKDIYSKPSQNNIINNNWLLYSNILYILLILGILLCIVLTIRLVCNYNTFPFWHIVKENMIIFLFVGLIEVFFFFNIALKYIPTKPSLLINSIINSFKGKFKN
jgi:uncharacterized protein involved in cysteine biosynthesis